jgi:GrpB-like predicted nucleotidyltransferase (UPF0157 family)
MFPRAEVDRRDDRPYTTPERPLRDRSRIHRRSGRAAPVRSRDPAFRDYVRAHPAAARSYEAEKRRGRDLHPHDLRAYTDAKADWIGRIESVPHSLRSQHSQEAARQ